MKSLLDRQLNRLNQLDDGYGTARAVIFVAGLAAVSILTAVKSPIASPVAIVLLVAFVVLVWLNAKVRRGLHSRRLYRAILDREAAKRRLDFSALPSLPPIPAKAFPRYFSDLDLLADSGLVRLLNSTVSNAGLDRLVAHFLSNDIEDEAIKNRQSLVMALKGKHAFRRKLLRAARLESEGLVDLQGLDEVLATPFHSDRAPRLVAVQLGLQCLAVILAVFFVTRTLPPVFLFPWFGAFILFSLAQKHFFNPFGRAVYLETTLSKFGRIARLLERYHPTGEALTRLLEPFKKGERPSRVLSELGFLVSLLSVRAHPVVYVAIHILIPWDFLVSLRLERFRQRLRSDIAAWVDGFAELEALLSLAEFAELAPDSHFPELITAKTPTVAAEGLRHPLIPREAAVANPVKIDEAARCHLITGSNMSGKSTFLRTIGVNLLLAKAGAPVLASTFRFSNVNVHTMLRVADSLEDHVSSFYAEVKELKHVLDEASAAEGPPVLYLIDEIFRGTNNRERLLGSRAYVDKMLTLRAGGLIATHDLELVELEKAHKGIVNFHFRETIEGDKMHFTYRLESGPCPTTNALRIMEMAGLPVK